MNVKLTNNKIKACLSTLVTIGSKDLPVKASYAIVKNRLKIEKIYMLCEDERIKLVNKYGPKDSDGKLIQDENGMIQLSPENTLLYNADYLELLSIENDVDIHQFSIDIIEHCNIKPDELAEIEFMITE